MDPLRSTGIVMQSPCLMTWFRSWWCLFRFRAGNPILQESDQSYLGWMALSCSKNAEKRCSLASLPIQLHRIARISFFCPESRVHQSVIMPRTLATEICF